MASPYIAMSDDLVDAIGDRPEDVRIFHPREHGNTIALDSDGWHESEEAFLSARESSCITVGIRKC